jgi:hypothetical protein
MTRRGQLHRRVQRRGSFASERFPIALLNAGLSNGFVLSTFCVTTLFALGLAPASAQTWVGTTSDWNTAVNWNNPASVPVSGGTAIFGAVPNTSITFNAPANVGTLLFDAPGYSYEYLPFGPNLTIDGDGIQVNPGGGNPTFQITQDAPMNFHNNSTAGTAEIIAGLVSDPTGGFQAGFIKFFDTSSADHATITAQDDSNIEFHDSSKAANATLVSAAGGDIFFNDKSTADHATITVQDGGFMEFGHLDPPEFNGGPASAGDAQITIDTGGFARFQTEATAGSAIITNSGTLEFDDTSSAGSATITTTTPFGVTNFHDTSNAGTATFAVGGEGILNFFNQSSAQAASIQVDGTSSVNFNDRSTAGTAKFTAGLAGSNAGNDPFWLHGRFRILPGQQHGC